jgi:cation:H+ antiporter
VDVLLVVVGLLGLYLGGELLVRSASALARALGLSPLVIGLTVVAFGTSAPELAATIAAALRGAPEIALGNVVGSNIANVGLILALTALVFPLVTRWAFVRRELPVLLAATALGSLLLLDGRLGRPEGVVLLLGLVAFLALSFRGGSPTEAVADPSPRSGSVARSAALATLGIGVLVGGAQALVAGAVDIAAALGVSERVIGLTMVAIGTSLPELASSIVAALRRETDIILGNIVGSNVFNLFAVLGVAALVHPITVDAVAVRADLLVMAAFSIVMVPMVLRGLRLGRREGAALLAAYGVYVAFLFS